MLISSRTNLAVDNALERLATQTSIFPVRLGRIEAVKLNPVLHIDTASKRYRDRLLSRSHAAEVSMLSQVDGCADLPSEEEFWEWLKAWEGRIPAQSVASQSHQAGTTGDILALHSYDIFALLLHRSYTEYVLSDIEQREDAW